MLVLLILIKETKYSVCYFVSPNRREQVREKAREVRAECEMRGPRDHQEELEARLSELAKLTNCATADIAIKLATDMIKH